MPRSSLKESYKSWGRQDNRDRRALEAAKKRKEAAQKDMRPGYDRVGIGYYGRFATAATPGTGELKFFDSDTNDALIAQTGTILGTGSQCLVPQGVTESTRIGRKMTIRSINWRYNLTLATSTTTTADGDTVRLILYLDKQCNGATAAVTDILETAEYQSFNNLSNKDRFTILADRHHTLNSGSALTLNIQGVQENGSFFKKCALPIEYSSTTGAISEIRSNNIGILTVSKNDNLVALDGRMRIRFSDS